MAVIVCATEGLAQFLQGIGAESAEHEQTAGLQHPVHLGKRAVDVIAPLQRQIRPHQTGTGILQWHLFNVTTHMACLIPANCQQLLPPGNEGTRLKMHCWRNIDCQHSRAGVAQAQLTRAMAGAAAGVDNDIGRVLNVIEPRQHPVAHFALKDCRLIVTRRCSLKGVSHLALIEGMVVIQLIDL